MRLDRFCWIFLLLLPSVLVAQGPAVRQVEIIVFTRDGPDTLEDWYRDEGWPTQSGLILAEAAETSSQLGTDGLAQPLLYTQLPDRETRIGGALQRLQNQGNVQVRQFLAWRQSGRGQRVAVSWNDEMSGERIEGFVVLSSASRPQLRVDLGFIDTSTGTPRTFRIAQRETLAIGQARYFDHRRFGVIVLVTPVETAAVETPAPEDPSPR